MSRFENPERGNHQESERVFTREEVKKILQTEYIRLIAIGGMAVATFFSGRHLGSKAFPEKKAAAETTLTDENYKSENDRLFESTYSKEDVEEYTRIRAALYNYIGARGLVDIESADADAIRKKAEGSKTAPEISGFEKTKANIPILKKVWKEGEFYPVGWVNGDINVIEYKDEVLTLRNHSYGDKLKDEPAAATMGEKRMTFYKVEEKKEPQSGVRPLKLSDLDMSEGMDVIFGHEIGHANAWDTDKDLTLLQRIQLLEQVLMRVRGMSPMKDEYVDKIEHKDKKLELYNKCTEYWAQICQQYFCSPEHLKFMQPDDYKLVDKYVKLSDSRFDAKMAASRKFSLFHPGTIKGRFVSMEGFDTYTYENYNDPNEYMPVRKAIPIQRKKIVLPNTKGNSQKK